MKPPHSVPTKMIPKIIQRFSRLSLRWKIYSSLTGILLPVFGLMLFLQTKVTRPLLEEEVRELGLSMCRSLSSDLIAYHYLLSQPDQLEARLLEITWSQPSISRLDVVSHEGDQWKILASNIVEETPFDFSALSFTESPTAVLKTDGDRHYWEIIYPIKRTPSHKPTAFIHAEVSLVFVNHVVETFTRIAYLSALLTIALLIGLLSYFLRKMIENEKLLQVVESENVVLTKQLHETQRQLFLNEKLAIMGQLTASMAHEIGTPLNSLSGHLQLLRDEVKDEDGRQRLNVINSQVSRIEGIVKNFLAFTHTPTQQKQLVDMRALIQRIVNLVAPRLSQRDIAVSINVAEDVPPIRAVPTDLEQVLLNLTNNALDALEANKSGTQKIVYDVRTLDKTLQINVSDTGEGIDQSNLKQVMKPFFTTKAPGKGTGLGLAICQRLIKKYGGRIDLESTLGKGTTVKVSLPYDDGA